ncbi:MAG: trimethylamine corrinoid protein 2 [Eubacteriales bacterium]
MKYKSDWGQAKTKWQQYWKHQNTGRPLMCVIARSPESEKAWQKSKLEGKKGCAQFCQGIDYLLPDELMYRDMEDKYQKADRMVERYRHFCGNHVFLAESFPNINIDFGPGSMAGYLGSNIVFNDDTVWFEHCVDDWSSMPPLVFDSENKWWKKHNQLATDVSRLVGNDFYVGMPDIMENMDVLASLRGTQDIIYDLIDEPDEIKKRIEEVGGIYFDYYDRFYNLIKNKIDGGSCYTVFQILGPGKLAKLQCDFSAMMSPKDFRTFIQPSLREQAKQLDTVLYHLDGADSIRHMDALMEIEEIDALQWTSGDYGPDGTLEDWFEIYDKTRAAGKSLWVKVYTGEIDDWIKNVDKLVKRYGSHSLFMHFPEMSMQEAEKLLNYAEKHWSDIEGSFK